MTQFNQKIKNYPTIFIFESNILNFHMQNCAQTQRNAVLCLYYMKTY